MKTELEWSTSLSSHVEPNVFMGRWMKVNPLNTPGVIYGADTDTTDEPMLFAPNFVANDVDMGSFVFRQPMNLNEFRFVQDAASLDPDRGFGVDGLQRWTLASVEAWAGEINEKYATIDAWRRTSQRPHMRESYSSVLQYYDEHLEDYIEWFLESLDVLRCVSEKQV